MKHLIIADVIRVAARHTGSKQKAVLGFSLRHRDAKARLAVWCALYMRGTPLQEIADTFRKSLEALYSAKLRWQSKMEDDDEFRVIVEECLAVIDCWQPPAQAL